jgi:hypothetical protein
MNGSNPLRILRALDEALHTPVSLYLFGRAALALGFPDAPAQFHATMHIDAILPERDLPALEANDDFWAAQERVNTLLGDAGLYFTHLFVERQIILTPDWFEKCLPIAISGLQHLRVLRPSTPDLILTKMMRIDPQDREDIQFLHQQADATPSQIIAALASAVVPPVPEIEEAFAANRAWLLPRLAA